MNRNLLRAVLAGSPDETARGLARAVLEGDLDALAVLWDRLEETGATAMQSLNVGQCYLITTPHGSYTGRVKSVSFTDVVLEEAAYVAYLQRRHETLTRGELIVVDPYPDEVILATGFIIEAARWGHPLPRERRGDLADEIPF
jgi:hypothetical protein